MKARGLCSTHYKQQQRGTLVETPINPTDPKPVEIRLPSRDTQEVKNTPTPKKRTASKGSKLDKKTITGFLSGLIVIGTGAIASRVGDHWAFGEDESTKIAEPIMNMAEEANLLEKVEDHGNGLLLTFALGMAVVPRILYEITLRQEKKKEGKQNVQPVRQQTTTAQPVGGTGTGGISESANSTPLPVPTHSGTPATTGVASDSSSSVLETLAEFHPQY